MNDTLKDTQVSILAGVRDNLLKPMANEIKQNQNNGQNEIRKSIADLSRNLNDKIAALEDKIAKLEAKLDATENERKAILTQVKWDE